MKRLSIVILAGLTLTTVAPQLEAYELAPHGRMTNEAFKESILVDPEFTKQLGFENVEEPFWEIFYDVFRDAIHIRTFYDFESTEFRMPDDARP